MDSLIAVMERTARPASGTDLGAVILCVLMAFILGQAIAWTYAYTHSGLSYTRSFTQSLVVLTLIVALVMMVIGNNIVTAFGLIGALAIIRFRNVLKDTRDTVFVFLVLVIGMAVGSGKFMTAVVGTSAAILLLVYMHKTEFGALSRFDAHLSFLAPLSAPSGEGASVDPGEVLSPVETGIPSPDRRRVTCRSSSIRYRYAIRINLKNFSQPWNSFLAFSMYPWF